jgi:hypothetical protein
MRKMPRLLSAGDVWRWANGTFVAMTEVVPAIAMRSCEGSASYPTLLLAKQLHHLSTTGWRRARLCLWKWELAKIAGEGHSAFESDTRAFDELMHGPSQIWTKDLDSRLSAEDVSAAQLDPSTEWTDAFFFILPIPREVIVSNGSSIAEDLASEAFGLPSGVSRTSIRETVTKEVEQFEDTLSVGCLYLPLNGSTPVWREDRVTASTCHRISPILAMHAFMQQPFCEARREALSRPVRKREMALNKEIPEIQTILLRAADRGAAQDHPESRDWQHQWIVRGHWRNQFFPSKQEHQPVWVKPYLKGPEGKPLLPTRPVVAVVAR